MGANVKVGISGLPQAGKTTTLLKVIEMLEADGKKVGGMVTEAMVEVGRRVGFWVQDWATKEKKVLAHKDFKSKIMVGRYAVDVDVLENVGVNAIRQATATCDVVVVDEVGKMEVESPSFVGAVKEAFDADKPLILTMHKKSRNPLLQDIRRRDDIRILEVTAVNRNLLPYKIVKLLKGEIL